MGSLVRRFLTPSVSLRSTDLRHFTCLLPALRAAGFMLSKREPLNISFGSVRIKPPSLREVAAEGRRKEFERRFSVYLSYFKWLHISKR